MQRYTPILAGRMAELTALEHLPPALVTAVVPVLEVQSNPRKHPTDTTAFFALARATLPADLRFGVDLGRVPDPTSGIRFPAYHLAEEFALWGLPMTPVIRLSDSSRRLTAHGDAARLHDNTAILRVRPFTDATDAADAHRLITKALRLTKLSPDQVDLVIDLGQISAATLSSTIAKATALVRWSRTHRWRSTMVATGAMRTSLSEVTAPGRVAVQRSDYLLWRQLRDLDVGCGDYGVRSPTAAATVRRGPLPNVRYTSDTCWWVYRWPHSVDGGGHGIYPLCRTVVRSDHWTSCGPDYSWGDRQIFERAEHRDRPGTATDWIAWATSHHITHTLTQLNSETATPPTGDARPGRKPHYTAIHDQPVRRRHDGDGSDQS